MTNFSKEEILTILRDLRYFDHEFNKLYKEGDSISDPVKAVKEGMIIERLKVIDRYLRIWNPDHRKEFRMVHINYHQRKEYLQRTGEPGHLILAMDANEFQNYLEAFQKFYRYEPTEYQSDN